MPRVVPVLAPAGPERSEADGDGGGFMNMDLEPSTNRPPKGGPRSVSGDGGGEVKGAVREDCEIAG